MSEASPFVSAVLLTHNCAEFVSDAIRSVLNQDCEPIEIIVSDDASEDATVEAIHKEVSQYHGPHKIEVRCRISNSGSKSAHLNDVLKEVSGEIIVSFDGDDIAHTSRITKVARVFRRNPATQAVYSAYSLIDEVGRRIGSSASRSAPPRADSSAWFANVGAYASGGTLAFRRKVFEAFGPLDPDIHEDVVLPFRASLLGEVVFLDEELVNARRHMSSFTQKPDMYKSIEKYRERFLWGIEQARRQCASRFADLQTAMTIVPARAVELDELREIIAASMADVEFSAGLVSPSIRTRIRTLFGLLGKETYENSFARDAFLAVAPNLYLRHKRRSLGISHDKNKQK